MTSPSRHRLAYVAVTLAGVLLALVGTTAVTLALLRQQPAPPSPTPAAMREQAGSIARGSTSRDQTAPSPTGASAGDRTDRPTSPSRRVERSVPQLDWSRPTRVVIPKLDVAASLESLGLDSAGAMEVPREPARAGWFTPAPPPGMVGASVIAGHVTWDQQPAVFFDLGRLRTGDRVEVERRDGTTAVFEVRRIGEFAKDEFPTEAVYRSGRFADLRLITCGGTYDDASNRYLSNVIVWARMVSSHPT